MSHQTVPAGNGLQWLINAVNLILKNPGPFALMGLLVGVIMAVPILGSLAWLVLGPALSGGLIYAAREQEAGRPADFQHLFQAFREDGKLIKMIMLCLPYAAAGAIMIVLMLLFFGGALLGVVASGGSESAVGAGVGLGLVLFGLVAIAVGLLCFALTFFSTPKVMLGDAEPFAAMKESAQACLANVGAVLIYLAIQIGALIVLGVILAFIPLIGQVILMAILQPIAAVASYLAWREVYRPTQELPSAGPPTPPPPAV